MKLFLLTKNSYMKTEIFLPCHLDLEPQKFKALNEVIEQLKL